MMRQAFSAVYITLNAERVLEESLKSIAFADEIIVVDSGSTDKTLEIAQQYHAKIIRKEWQGFGAQKEFAVQKAANNWVLCLDADEVLTPELAQSIRKFLENPSASSAKMARANVFLGKVLRFGEGCPDWNIRLFQRQQAHWSDDVVHEKVFVQTRPATLKGDLMHYSSETLFSYLQKQNRYSTLLAKAAIENGAKPPTLFKLLASPWVRFVKFYFIRQGFRDGIPGLIHICIGCFASLLKHAKIWEEFHLKN